VLFLDRLFFFFTSIEPFSPFWLGTPFQVFFFALCLPYFIFFTVPDHPLKAPRLLFLGPWLALVLSFVRTPFLYLAFFLSRVFFFSTRFRTHPGCDFFPQLKRSGPPQTAAAFFSRLRSFVLSGRLCFPPPDRFRADWLPLFYIRGKPFRFPLHILSLPTKTAPFFFVPSLAN